VLRASPLCTCCRHYPGTVTGGTTPLIRTPSYQPSPVWPPGRPVQRPFRGLLNVHSRYGLHTRAVTVFRDTLHQRLQPFRYLHSRSGCFRLEHSPGGICTHWENAAFPRRTPQPDLQNRTFKRLFQSELIVSTIRMLYSSELREQLPAVAVEDGRQFSVGEITILFQVLRNYRGHLGKGKIGTKDNPGRPGEFP